MPANLESRSPRRAKHASLYIHIATLFTLLILAAGAIQAWTSYRHGREMLLSAAAELFERIARETALQIENTYRPVEVLIDLVSYTRLSTDTALAERMSALPLVKEALDQTPSAAALYIGYEDGDFFLVRPLRGNEALAADLRAPRGTAYVVQSIERDPGAPARRTFVYFDGGLNEIGRRDAPEYDLDPRTREWYRLAAATSGQIKTPPYPFYTTREVGTTVARRTRGGAAVVGADIAFGVLSQALQQQRITPSAELALFNKEGRVAAHTHPERIIRAVKDVIEHARVEDLGVPALSALMQGFRAGATGGMAVDVDGERWQAYVVGLPVKGLPAGAFLLALTAPEQELLVEAERLRRNALVAIAIIVLLTVPIAWLLSLLISRPIRHLTAEARSVQEFDFTSPITTRSAVAEIDDLAITMDAMKTTIQRFLDIAAAISAEHNFERLLERVLAETMASAGAIAGSIHLLDDDGRTLECAAIMPSGGAAVISDAGAGAIAQRAVASGRTAIESCDQPIARSAIAVPLRNRAGQIVGALHLLTPARPDEMPRALVSFIESLSGTAAVAIENQRLLKAQKDLLEALIKLVAQAIDAKSPYTGGHCQRVPELTKMLARAACDANAGPFRDFKLDDEQWEALHIACWLHDCGKVTTPEYIVDKATKLETIYDRLHEVRMRFEVLKRDAEIAYWRKLAKGGDREQLRAALDAAWHELDDDFAFVASCNAGGEYMAPERIERIHRIAERTWTRTLDDHIGISQDERARKPTPKQALPVIEPLLADKEEHIIQRTAAHLMPENNPWGFKLSVPTHLYNRGEIYNLCIGRGTLTEEDRYKINDHIVQTVIMLSALPFPKHLKEVPAIAGGHHEKMDGTGYPRRLKREEMSVTARMMAIADIFEALTAVDRPYKSGKKLSEAVKIMNLMKRDQHIDPELFDLFLSSGVYRQYAERFLDPAQIDDVDIQTYLATGRASHAM